MLIIPKKLSQFALQIEEGLKNLFKISPIIDEQTGYLNSFILFTGLFTMIPFSLSIFMVESQSVFLTIISVLAFLLSVKFSKSHVIHTLACIFVVINIAKPLSQLLSIIHPIGFYIVTLIVILFLIYFDLLKKNFVLQFASLGVLNILIAKILIDFGLIPNFDQFEGFEVNNIPFTFLRKVIPFLNFQLIFSFVLILISLVSKYTNRIPLAKFLSISNGIMILVYLALLSALTQTPLNYFYLTCILIVALILSIYNKQKWTQLYVLGFLIGCLAYLSSMFNLSSSSGLGLVTLIFGGMCTLMVFAKRIID
ncbi:MAG: hypothetical protein ACRCXZ_03070 [Patescibacteria group bacterium]